MSSFLADHAGLRLARCPLARAEKSSTIQDRPFHYLQEDTVLPADTEAS